MKTQKLYHLLAGLTCMLLLLAACQKNSEKIKSKKTLAAASNEVSLLACTMKDTVINGTGGNFYNYVSWPKVNVTLPLGARIRFEGYSHSFIRDSASNWFIGILEDLDDSCATWADVRSSIIVKNAAANIGAVPDTIAYPKYNVVGIDGSFAGKNYGRGYYVYSSTTHLPEPNALVVIWKDTGPTWPSGISNPANLNSPEAFVISVHDIVLTTIDANTHTDKVYFGYRRLL